ncbi:MAG: tyrosine--tRNA ligase [Pseudomonadales bacterium]|nr:tyrosine--tRNA ligase [Gammaproteobacteria bacterium]MBP6053615.1 tyrosine--tRNA ligase [Pseudomonadales bacterium]MBK6581414.1 tyrosine--tRNA ligase [Gammaproteobacteria bacterium]MBK7167774.1 tyrosine--tRNA ligase [Gammaproteobacteria bacterium]MBK7518636.1 tyrosine--tRNA ligase [Gammaproteobacteria bacterium]
MPAKTDLLLDLDRRGLIVQSTPLDTLRTHLNEQSRSVYCGFDPTADSLHIGSLVPLLALRRFQLAGHRPIALVGGATGLVGDPSFKLVERNLNAAETVSAWSDSIKAQILRFLDGSGEFGALVVNNLDWFSGMSLLDFLRQVGKHFSINAMIQKDSVKQRIERDDVGISFAEFSYMILQAFDFAELNRRFQCSLQIGGSDQWGNITGGIDLCRRQNGIQVHALTFPLVTQSDGTKFGKTESGTVWLDPDRTSPYAFYQFWINSSDADVYRFMKLFTMRGVDEIEEIERVDAQSASKPAAHAILAREVTELVHGREGLLAAVRISDALFAGVHEDLAENDFVQLRLDGLPSSDLKNADLQRPLTSLITESGAGFSGKQTKDALARHAISINGRACGLEDNESALALFARDRAMHGRFFLVRLGKKKYHLFELVNKA